MMRWIEGAFAFVVLNLTAIIVVLLWAVTMAFAHFSGKRTGVILSPALHPQYRQTVHTYTLGTEITISGEECPLQAGPEALLNHLDANTALVIVQYPDFFGRIYDYSALAEAVHQAGALLAVAVNPIALGMLKPPGEF